MSSDIYKRLLSLASEAKFPGNFIPVSDDFLVKLITTITYHQNKDVRGSALRTLERFFEKGVLRTDLLEERMTNEQTTV